MPDPGAPGASSSEQLAQLGLRAGEAVRFRKIDGGRWWNGRMSSVAADGSFTIYDTDGAARSLRPERIEVRRPANRGRLTWQLLSDVAITWEQLELWSGDGSCSGGGTQHVR
ncbi:MAG: hypothetical protein JWM12_3194 [Ilumatobacteraceae bacterium]|jgi:hypothetical protein|nr:hypothetical protein [Ilumatobacteraceae bacterium]